MFQCNRSHLLEARLEELVAVDEEDVAHNAQTLLEKLWECTTGRS